MGDGVVVLQMDDVRFIGIIVYIYDSKKRNKLSHSNLINKAKRQSIEAFFEKGIWKIGATPSV